jgi:hypothetical protein
MRFKAVFLKTGVERISNFREVGSAEAINHTEARAVEASGILTNAFSAGF